MIKLLITILGTSALSLIPNPVQTTKLDKVGTVHFAAVSQTQPLPQIDSKPIESLSKDHSPLNQHEYLLSDAGVPYTQWSAAEQLIQNESGWNPNAINPHSGACGLAQELPCGKSGCNLGDQSCELTWQYSYVTKRYGGYNQALEFWQAQSPHWY